MIPLRVLFVTLLCCCLLPCLTATAAPAPPVDYSALSEAIAEVQAAIDGLKPYQAKLDESNAAADLKQTELAKLQEELAAKIHDVEAATGELLAAAEVVEQKIARLRRLLNPPLPEPLPIEPTPAALFRAKSLAAVTRDSARGLG